MLRVETPRPVSQEEIDKFYVTGINGAELLGLDLAEKKWLIDGLLCEGVTLLVGDSKIGKSFLCMQLAVSIATGRLTLGLEVPVRSNVCYYAFEDDLSRVQKRARRDAEHMGCESVDELGKLNFRFRSENVGKFTTDVKSIAQKGDAALIIIDTMQFARPKEKSRDLYAGDYSFLGEFKTISRETGVSILLVHHTNQNSEKSGLDRVSGSTGLVGAADAILIMKKVGGGASLSCVGRDFEQFEIKMEFVSEIWELVDPETVKKTHENTRAKISKLFSEKQTLTLVEIKSSIPEVKSATVDATLSRMVDAGELQRTARGEYTVRIKVE